MTNGEAYEALNVASALPLDLCSKASFTPALILIRSGLQRVVRDLEPQRQGMIADALAAAKAPEDFYERMSADEKDPETERILTEVNDCFLPAWMEVMKEESSFRYPLLSPSQFAGLYSSLTAPGSPSSFTVGSREVSLPELLAFVADYLVEPGNTTL